MYFFPELHVPGLTYSTYVIVIVFVRTAEFQERSDMPAWDARPQVLTPEEGQGALGVGLRDVS